MKLNYITFADQTVVAEIARYPSKTKNYLHRFMEFTSTPHFQTQLFRLFFNEKYLGIYFMKIAEICQIFIFFTCSFIF